MNKLYLPRLTRFPKWLRLGLQLSLLTMGLCAFSQAPCLDIGQPLPAPALTAQNKVFVLTSPGSLVPGVEFTCDKIKYTAAAAKGRCIFISTADPTFRTPEGVTLASTFGELNAPAADALLRPGWARTYRLPSGWCCAFDFNRNIQSSSSPVFFFKEK